MLTLLLLLSLDPAAAKVRVALALAEPVQSTLPAKPPASTLPPASPPGLGTQAALVWRRTTDAQQVALFRGSVQIGVWHHVLQVYWPCNPAVTEWGEASLPPIDPPAKRLMERLPAPRQSAALESPNRPEAYSWPAAPELLLVPARQNC